jgi:hypothetical protein
VIGACLAAVGAGGAAGEASGEIATFDSLPEGFHGLSLETGGITFFDPVHFFGEPAPFAVEDVSVVLPGIPGLGEHFSPPNVLGLAGFIEGPTGWLMGRIEQIKMTTGEVESYARMDVFYDNNVIFAGTVVTLEAILAGEVVGKDTFTIVGSDPKDPPFWNELEIGGVEFDTLRLIAVGGAGGPDDNGFLGSIDNVEMVPGVGTGVIGVLAVLGLARRRR